MGSEFNFDPNTSTKQQNKCLHIRREKKREFVLVFFYTHRIVDQCNNNSNSSNNSNNSNHNKKRKKKKQQYEIDEGIYSDETLEEDEDSWFGFLNKL